MLRHRWPIGTKNFLRSATGILSASFFVSSVNAAPYAQRLTQYGHTAWHVQDGLFNSPNSIAQTNDGYLWLGTDTGLVRFDGVRFVPWNSFSDGSIATWAIYRVLGARDGSLWIATTARVAQVRDRRISRYENLGRAVDMVEDDSGAIWFARTRVRDGTGPACSVSHGKLVCYGKPDIPYPFAGSIGQSNGGGFWLGSSYGLCHWLPGQAAECYLQDALRPLNGLTGANALLTTRDGTLWVGMGRPGKDLGLGRFVRGKWEPVEAKGLDPSTLSVTKLTEDREGSVWVGTLDQGLYRIRAGVAEHFGASDGLSGNAVTDIYEDREGIIWVSTSDGLDSFRRLAVSVFSTREGLPANDVEAVLPARDGSIWIGNSVLSRLVEGMPEPPPNAALFGKRAVTSLLEDSAGRLWIGLNKTLNVFSRGELHPIRSANGSDLGVIALLTQDALNDVWAVTSEDESHIFRIRDMAVVEEIDSKSLGTAISLAPDPVNGVWLGFRNGAIAHYHDGHVEMFAADSVTGSSVSDLLPQKDGTILAASLRGLLVKRGSSLQLLNSEHGLPCENLTAVLRDLKNAIWLSSRCGLIEIADAELARWLADPDIKIEYQVFDSTDGVQSGHGDFTPNAKMDRDGRLWFATGKVAQMIAPEEVSVPQTPPMVRIEQVTADRKTFAVDAELTLPAKTRDLEIQYTALSFRVPQKIQFRYQLEGRDRTWIDAGTRRAAFYADLAPGRYRFRVIANSAGLWNTSGASLNFSVPPAFYQTKWFYSLCALSCAALLSGLYRFRIRQVSVQVRGRLEERLAERERIARELHDTLLQGLQGLVLRFQAAADCLPAQEPVRTQLEDALERADQVLSESRDAVKNIRGSSGGEAELAQTLAATAKQLAQAHLGQFRASVEGAARELHPIVREEALQIAREALTNAFQHAKAELVEVEVSYGDAELHVRVRDDGQGMNDDVLLTGRPGHWGLLGMRERAKKIRANLTIWSKQGAGTEIDLRVPSRVAYRSRSSRHFGWRWLDLLWRGSRKEAGKVDDRT
jgi:signal transduction histidine kinase/ligand-binding sensor domain-containing protein